MSPDIRIEAIFALVNKGLHPDDPAYIPRQAVADWVAAQEAERA